MAIHYVHPHLVANQTSKTWPIWMSTPALLMPLASQWDSQRQTKSIVRAFTHFQRYILNICPVNLHKYWLVGKGNAQIADAVSPHPGCITILDTERVSHPS